VAKNKNAKLYQIFVSHATADKWLAVTLCEKLEKVGAQPFGLTAISMVETTYLSEFVWR